jgi:hypothetical protein
VGHADNRVSSRGNIGGDNDDPCTLVAHEVVHRILEMQIQEDLEAVAMARSRPSPGLILA